MEASEILSALAEHGLIDETRATVEPLTGGVSSDICVVSDGQRRLVIKQALPQLRVAARWLADPIRNRYEQAYISFVAGIDATAVPQILHSDPERSFFAMEYLAPPLENWKSRLLVETGDRNWAARAGEILGKIHAASWDREDVRGCFETTANFHELRSAPYFLYAAERHPEVAELMRERTAALEGNRRCLVHGDFSPKNILVSADRLVLLDCEVAWFGDPAFDAGFLLNHLFLKALNRPERAAEYFELGTLFWSQYGAHMGASRSAEVERSLGWLLPMLMLARVDGKSPVEYLPADKMDRIRRFAIQRLQDGPLSVSDLQDAWQGQIEKIWI
jgi:aminoglycoside phosphotransferase (APT) family kinase protein